MLSSIVMKNLLSAAWKNSSRHKIGQFELLRTSNVMQNAMIVRFAFDRFAWYSRNRLSN